MYKAYNLSLLDFGNSSYEFFEIGNSSVVQDQNDKFDDKIDSFVNRKTGRLNASNLTSNWFPLIDADIFISHSHQDYEDVVALAGWLYKNFNIISFVDESVWGFCEKLLKLIDDRYCPTTDGKYYDYKKRIFSTSHVYMMLAMSIAKMIHNTECVFFL